MKTQRVTTFTTFIVLAIAILALMVLQSATVQAADECRPQNVLATLMASDQVTITWEQPDDCEPTGYNLLRRSKTDGTWDGRIQEHVQDIAGLTHTDTDVEPEKFYRYRVGVIGGKWSTTRADVTTPAAPQVTPPSTPEP